MVGQYEQPLSRRKGMRKRIIMTAFTIFLQLASISAPAHAAPRKINKKANAVAMKTVILLVPGAGIVYLLVKGLQKASGRPST
jgi:hypothetical protein